MADLFRSSSISLPPSLLANIPALASLNSLGKGSLPTEADVDTKYEAKFKGNQADDDQEVERMRKLKIEETTTLNQRLNQVEDQPRIVSAVRPQRILLRTKRAKRCKDCDHVLVKPEQKAQSSKFTIQLPAIDYIPRVTIAHPLPSLPLQPGTNVTLNLRVTNPQSTALRVMIAPQIKNDEEYSLGYSITVLAPTFTLKAHDEVNEFEEDKSKHELEAGVVKKSHNWAIIPVSCRLIE
ncbi:hypothetical protein BCR33DRAFT_497451 [Rhizoclosmatium globosum]|uniref:Dynactin subunit 4 n=1 Tax=Rhizoclosmatium globosum TaxID=329046 RepID=A0A1Y2CUY9_9FUNG|nr:hypothetical protein BCR33DRAFT_497451 [Rhizoclosmatium globosum]|eukprot:ORY50880.1 hypothetical protein BCR33DRAFT_497451 [Rhizoclosmatium globosum]